MSKYSTTNNNGEVQMYSEKTGSQIALYDLLLKKTRVSFALAVH